MLVDVLKSTDRYLHDYVVHTQGSQQFTKAAFKQDTEVDIEVKDDLKSLFYIDLHGLSKSAASLALHARLSQIATIHAIGANNLFAKTFAPTHNSDTAVTDLAKKHGLVIVVGKGLHSKKTTEGDGDHDGVLGDYVAELLEKRGLTAHRVHGNSGRFVIKGPLLVSWLDRMKRTEQQGTVWDSAGIRMWMMGAASASAVACVIVVPVLLKYTSDLW